MDIVIDANVLFAAVIKEDTSYHLLFDDNLHLYSPEFILDEIEKHKEEILQKTHRNKEEFYKLLEVLKRRIVFVSLDELTPFLEKAERISPDPKDVTYIALALKLNTPIWSNDKDLKEKQNVVKIYSTDRVMKL